MDISNKPLVVVGVEELLYRNKCHKVAGCSGIYCRSCGKCIQRGKVAGSCLQQICQELCGSRIKESKRRRRCRAAGGTVEIQRYMRGETDASLQMITLHP